MDFKQLEYFLETADAKCISKAAKKTICNTACY